MSDERLQQIIIDKDVEKAEYGEAWSIIDNCIVIYDCEDTPPHWLPQNRDEDGNTSEFVERMNV